MDSTGMYQNALAKSDYEHQLSYDQPTPQPNPRKRQRNILWYNPPFSLNVATNVGKQFLRIIDEEFPHGTTLHKLFNRNSTKISYSCMNSMKAIIAGHNSNILTKQTPIIPSTRKCNCRVKNNCPMDEKCLTRAIIYQATVQPNNSPIAQTYVGLTEGEFKTRFNNHTASFRHRDKSNETELSKYIWNLKDAGTDYSIKWKVLKHAKPFSNTTQRCNLCLWEKFFIIYQPSLATLNTRNELVSTCRHSRKFLLSNIT
jgi:hypothetical protein